jgi:hypothetical protein
MMKILTQKMLGAQGLEAASRSSLLAFDQTQTGKAQDQLGSAVGRALSS